MSAPAYNVLTHVNAYLLSDSPVKLDDAQTLAPTVTGDTIRGDLANALQVVLSMQDDRDCTSVEHDNAIDAIARRLRSALAKVDDLLADQRAMRSSIVGAERERDDLRQQRLTIQPIAQDIEELVSKLMMEIRNR